MHMQGEPRSMQAAPQYDDVVARGAPLPRRAHLRRRDGRHRQEAASSSTRASASARRSSTTSRCSRSCERFAELGVPVLAGLSRKKTHRRPHRPRRSARARARLGRRAPDRRAARREAAARARRRRHRRCAEGLARGGRAADAEGASRPRRRSAGPTTTDSVVVSQVRWASTGGSSDRAWRPPEAGAAIPSLPPQNRRAGRRRCD